MIRIAASPYPGAWAPSHEHYQAGVSSLPHRRLSLPKDLLGPPHVNMSRRKYHCLLGLSSHIEVAIFLLDPWCYRSPLQQGGTRIAGGFLIAFKWGHGAPALHAHGFPISQKKYLIMVVFNYHLLTCYHRDSPCKESPTAWYPLHVVRRKYCRITQQHICCKPCQVLLRYAEMGCFYQ